MIARLRPLEAAVVRGRSVVRCGKGAILAVNHETKTVAVIPLSCKSWTCPRCRKYKAARWCDVVQLGKPARFITLTTRPTPSLSTTQAITNLHKSFRSLVRLARKVFGEFEYVRVIEFHKSGHPHIHIIQRGAYVPHRWLKATWHRLTGSFIVDIRKIKSPQIASRYLTKYLMKAADALTSRSAAKRLITKSRSWLLSPPKPSPHTQTPDLEYVYFNGHPTELHHALRAYFATVIEYHESTAYTLYSFARSPPVRLPFDQGARDLVWYALSLSEAREAFGTSRGTTSDAR